MIYNTGHRFTKLLTSVEQEQIYECPEYFAMSRDEIIKSGCPEFLKRTINEFPWANRPNVIQVRPQDFRRSKPAALGDGWHIDDNVRLKDGKVRVAKSLEDFRLLVVSFGGVVQTDFIATPLEMPDISIPGTHYGEFFSKLANHKFEIHQAAPNQLAEYTSKDIHRMGQSYNLGRLRLMIVAFESDEVVGDGIVLPSIKERETTGNVPKMTDYIT